MTWWQSGRMLHPGAQRSEHRTARTCRPVTPICMYVAAVRQSGHQLGAQSQHHLGVSFPLAQPHYIDNIRFSPNLLKSVSTFRVEDQADGLQDHGCDVHLVHAAVFSAVTKAKVKTDKRDAKTLALHLHCGNLPEAYLYPRETRGLRDLTRQRNYTVEKNSGVLRKLRCLLYREGHFDHQLDDAKEMEIEDLPNFFKDPMVQKQAEALIAEIKNLTIIRKAVEDHLLQTVEEHETHRLLQTIPGIGKILSLVIGTEVGDINRFRSIQGFCSYCRVAPGIAQSGSSTKRGRANKAGNPHLKRSFHQAAVSACTHHPLWHTWREKILARNSGNGARMKATNAVAHRIARISFAVLRNKTPYKESHSKES
jgi:transposase